MYITIYIFKSICRYLFYIEIIYSFIYLFLSILTFIIIVLKVINYNITYMSIDIVYQKKSSILY